MDALNPAPVNPSASEAGMRAASQGENVGNQAQKQIL